MLEQIHETKNQEKVLLPEQIIKEKIIALKKLKAEKDDLLFPVHDRLTEIEDETNGLYAEIQETMKEVQHTIGTQYGIVEWKLPAKPREFYDAKALNAITDERIREELDKCKKLTQQSEPKAVIKIF